MDYSDPNAVQETTYDTSLNTYDYKSPSEGSGVSGVTLILFLVVIVVLVAAMWRVFTKAGEAGWKSIIPLYNTYIMLRIVNRPGWWLLLYLIPLVNLVVSIITSIDLAKAFGKTTAFGIFGLAIFSFVGYPMLAFDQKAKYTRPAARA